MNDKQWLEKVELAAAVYCIDDDVNKEEIDKFVEFLFGVYGYVRTMNTDK